MEVIQGSYIICHGSLEMGNLRKFVLLRIGKKGSRGTGQKWKC